jgi:prolyl oligopeptidase
MGQTRPYTLAMRKHFFPSVLLCILLAGCSTSSKRTVASDSLDPFLWLEEVQGTAALDFAKKENETTFQRLKSDPRFGLLEKEIRAIVLATDRVPAVTIMGGKLYNFWQDSKNPRGLWRRTSWASYKLKEPQWEVILDLDELARSEGENWVWKGFECLEPAYDLCLLSLSRGGKDATVKREFSLRNKALVAGGFQMEEAKSSAQWLDENTLLVGTDFGSGSLSAAGYPIVTKIWSRGTPIAEAKELFRGEASDTWANQQEIRLPEGRFFLRSRGLSFFESEHWIQLQDQGWRKIPMPKNASFEVAYQERLFFRLRSELDTGKTKFVSGSLVALPLSALFRGNDPLQSLELVFVPTKKTFLQGVTRTKNKLYLSLLDNVVGRIATAKRSPQGQWSLNFQQIGTKGDADIRSADLFGTDLVLSYMDFLTPVSFLRLTEGGRKEVLKSSPQRFNPKGLRIDQWEATSKDGTKIPYFIVGRENLPRDSSNPTLLYGYGGFESPMGPFYLSAAGKVWLERGGVYVVANIRGGGEFGPDWHKAALRENRQRSFDDFIAVAEDLVKRKITSPSHLGIQGGSNGGLLTGTVFVQRPDLFGAVVSEVPLLDMLRYHLLLAGSSWMEEYGNPADPLIREALLKYSPYQNVSAGVTYPEPFFLTSTADDRVHPAHARKMVAKMRSLSLPVLYFENTEGGHGGAANLEQRILWNSLVYTYLWQKLERTK